MSSINGGSSFIPKGLGQIQGAQETQQTTQTQETKGSGGAKGVDNTTDSFGVVSGGQQADSPQLSETMAPLGANGTRADAGSLEGKARFLNDVSDAALMFSALMEMARVSQREMSDARDFKNAMHDGKIQAKKDGIAALEDQHEAERNAAWVQLGTSAVMLGLSIGMGAAGVNAGTINSVNQLGTQLTKTFDKEFGFQRQADDKKVEIKQHERMEAIFDDSIDSAKNTYEEAKEQFKSALRIITEHAEREANNTSRFTQT